MKATAPKRYRASIGNGGSTRREWVYLCSDIEQQHEGLFKSVSAAAVSDLVDEQAECHLLRTSVEQQKRLIESLQAELVESRSIDVSAPVERDERAMTKAFHDWAFYKKGEAIGRMDGQQAALEGFIAGADWQARAALERKP